MDILTNTGVFIYPLGLCSFVAVFVTIERLIALRPSRIIPHSIIEAFSSGSVEIKYADSRSVAGRIVAFNRSHKDTGNSLLAYAQFEISRMERGIFLLEVVVGAAPLLGLLGTVTGLTQVFSGFSAQTGLPDPGTFITGIALALNTTILGLAIAIPTLAAHAYITRRIESQATRLGIGVQAILDSDKA